jgi:hypothetical protein
MPVEEALERLLALAEAAPIRDTEQWRWPMPKAACWP